MLTITDKHATLKTPKQPEVHFKCSTWKQQPKICSNSNSFTTVRQNNLHICGCVSLSSRVEKIWKAPFFFLNFYLCLSKTENWGEIRLNRFITVVVFHLLATFNLCTSIVFGQHELLVHFSSAIISQCKLSLPSQQKYRLILFIFSPTAEKKPLTALKEP